MLSKESRVVFRIAKDTPQKKVAYLDLKKQLNWDYDKVKSAGNQLVEQGLATEVYSSSMPGRSNLWGIVLSEEGRNSKKYFWGRIVDFLFKSIVIPIIVAVITTLVTLWLRGLFPIK